MGVAVNVTAVPWHTESAEDIIVTFTGKTGLTVMVIGELGAGLFVVHNSLESNSQVTISPVEGIYVKVGESAPTLSPLIFH